MKTMIRTLVLLLISTWSYSQEYFGYSNEILPIASSALGDSIKLNLHLPETLPLSARSTKYPIAIIFDSQHDMTYPHIVNSFALLTNESQIPEMIIVGVPFDNRERYYLTSDKKQASDKQSGIQKTEDFLMEELIPLLQQGYKANDFIMVIGHSRTAFLVNYLTVNHSDKIDIAIALSGFFNNEPLSFDKFRTYISEASNFPNPFHYFFTAGTALEEELYLTEDRKLDQYLSNGKVAPNFKGRFSETPSANHITNFWMSVPPILVESFSAYNSILNAWLQDDHSIEKSKTPVEAFQNDLKKTSAGVGYNMNPSITQFFSLASHYAFQKQDYQTAIDFIKYGQTYYPDFLDFDLQLIAFYQQINNLDMVAFHRSAFKQKVQGRKDLSEAEKKEWLKNIEE